MPNIVFRILQAFTIAGGEGPIVVVQLLSDDTELETNRLTVCSERKGDLWRIDSPTIFGPPGLDQRMQSQGERQFMPIPIGSSRPIVTGEVFMGKE